LLSQIPCASMLMKCPFEVIIEEKEWFHYYKPGDYWITGIMSGVPGRLYQFSFSKPPTHQLKSVEPSLDTSRLSAKLLSQIPCASMLMKCPFEVIIEEKEWFHYYKAGDYWITGIMSGVPGRLYQFLFSKPPTHELK
ncbi:hypothetical protein E2320_014594, partial [Naja naja]